MARWKKILIELAIAILLIFLLLMLVEFWTGVNPLDNLFKRKEALSSINEVAAKLTTEVDGGTDGTITLYLKGVPEEELKSINYLMSNLNGSIETFALHPSLFGVQRVDFKIVRSDNSYVYDAYKNGTAIPPDRVEAQRLLRRVEQILEDNLKGALTDYQKELKLHDYLVNYCTYSHGSAENENEYRAYGALVEGQAVCNGYAEAMALLLSCAGVENQYVIGTARSSRSVAQEKAAQDDSGNTENHAWNIVRVNGTWYHLDTTWDDPVGDQELVSHAYFNLSDAMMSRDHTWNKENYDICPDMSWNYFYREHRYFEASSDLDYFVTQDVTIRPYGVHEYAFAQFDMTPNTLSGLSTVQSISKVYYSTVGDFKFTVLTLYVNQ